VLKNPHGIHISYLRLERQDSAAAIYVPCPRLPRLHTAQQREDLVSGDTPEIYRQPEMVSSCERSRWRLRNGTGPVADEVAVPSWHKRVPAASLLASYGSTVIWIFTNPLKSGKVPDMPEVSSSNRSTPKHTEYSMPPSPETLSGRTEEGNWAFQVQRLLQLSIDSLARTAHTDRSHENV
jgi:hypothetical protein